MPVEQEEERHAGTHLELKLADYVVRGALMTDGVEGTSFECTIGPVSDETMTALAHAAASHATICLLFPQPMLLDFLTLERKGPQRVRIAGRIFDAVNAAE